MTNMLDTTCWIPADLVQEYKWQQRFATKDIDKAEPFRFLARRCIAVGSKLHVKRPDGTWERHPKDTLARMAVHQYWRGKDPLIMSDDGKAFFDSDQGGIAQFDGEIVAPGLGEFVSFKGQAFINSYRDERLQPDPDAIDQAEPILRILAAICDLPETTPADLFQEALGDDRNSVFRWVLHWLASVYRRPGKHVPVGLAFVGENRGVGKGTLGQIMSRLVGMSFAKLFNAEDFEKGWANIGNALLVIMDEVQQVGQKDLFNFLSKVIGNPTTTVTSRYVGSIEFPTVANYLLATNREEFVDLPETDRRLMIVHTTDDASRNQHAVDFNTKLTNETRLAAIRGFGAILCRIEIDDTTISRPLQTKTREDLIAVNMNPVERWLYDADGGWHVGETNSFADVELAFRSWIREQGDMRHVSTKTIGAAMMRAVRKGYFQDRKVSTMHYTKLRYFKANTETILNAMSDQKKNERLAALTDSIMDNLGGRNLADLNPDELRAISDDFTRYLAYRKTKFDYYGVPEKHIPTGA